jgi:subtilisin family serine protease
MPPVTSEACPLCNKATLRSELAEAGWLDQNVVAALLREHPDWHRPDGACPACVQQALLQVLLERGEGILHEKIQAVWPIDAQAAFGIIPTPLRLHADPRFTAAGVTLALVDSGFYPHPDLTQPLNRIRAWVDVSRESVSERRFEPECTPRWPGWDAGVSSQWHGTMTSVVAAGNGSLSHGLYRGLASEADVVLVRASDRDGHISNDAIVRGLDWVLEHGPALGVRIVSLSVGGDQVDGISPIDVAVEALVSEGITVVAAAGNDGERRLVPPATAPEALTAAWMIGTRSIMRNG